MRKECDASYDVSSLPLRWKVEACRRGHEEGGEHCENLKNCDKEVPGESRKSIRA